MESFWIKDGTRVSPALAGGFSTTEPPGKCSECVLKGVSGSGCCLSWPSENSRPSPQWRWISANVLKARINKRLSEGRFYLPDCLPLGMLVFTSLRTRTQSGSYSISLFSGPRIWTRLRPGPLLFSGLQLSCPLSLAAGLLTADSHWTNTLRSLYLCFFPPILLVLFL